MATVVMLFQEMRGGACLQGELTQSCQVSNYSLVNIHNHLETNEALYVVGGETVWFVQQTNGQRQPHPHILAMQKKQTQEYGCM